MHDKRKNFKIDLNNNKVIIFSYSMIIALSFIFILSFIKVNQPISDYQLEHIKLLSTQQCSSTQKCYGIIQKRFKTRSIGDLKQKDYKTVVDLLNSL